MSNATTTRREVHEFGNFIVELWEDMPDGIPWTKMQICFGNYVIRTCREPVTLEEMKQDAKMWLFSATARWHSVVQDWDHTKVVTTVDT